MVAGVLGGSGARLRGGRGAGAGARAGAGKGKGLTATMAAVLLAAGCTAEVGGGGDPDPAAESVGAIASDANRYAGKHPPPIVSQLDEAAAGLLFMSESDYPFEVLYFSHPGGSPTAERVAGLTGHAGEAVEEQTLEAFFRGATTPQDGQTADELEAVRRYQDLVRLLRKKLSFIRVYRFGRIQIHSYVVGVTTSGAWAGLSTIQIET